MLDEPFPNVQLQSVSYAELTGDGAEEAVVPIHVQSGGTQGWGYLYVFTLAGQRPRLLQMFETGDRAFEGLYRAYGQNGELVIEVYDPDAAEGDCCSRGIIRRRYKWIGQRFQQLGSAEHRPTAPANADR